MQAGRKGKSVFATAPYEPDERGVLRPILPERCGLGPAGERCSVYVDHYRPRKTGPRFPVAVMGCSVHRERRFTLYPPGHIPYGRTPVVAASASGPLLRESASGRPAWEASVFAAALDAARGFRWPADSPWDDARRRRTQGRRLESTACLVGVHPELTDTERERIATRLGVPTLALRSVARSWTVSWVVRGAAIVRVLMALAVDALLCDRLLWAGAAADLWPVPRRWDPARGWLGTGSGRPESGLVRQARARDPPPTTLPAAPSAEAN